MPNDKVSQSLPERIELVYRSLSRGDAQVELPWHVLVLADFMQRHDGTALARRARHPINKHNFDEVMARFGIELDFSVPNRLSNDPDGQLPVKLAIGGRSGLSPDAIAKQVPELRQCLRIREVLVALKAGLTRADFQTRLTEALNDPSIAGELRKLAAPIAGLIAQS